MTLQSLLAVAFGGALGSLLRYGVGIGLVRLAPTALFPWPSFCVNLLGSGLMGILLGLSLREDTRPLSENLYLFLTVGLLGGFTTFSAFSADLFRLWQSDERWLFGLYIFASIALAYAALLFGLYLVGALTR